MRKTAALVVAAALWLPSLHLWFRPDPAALARGLEARSIATEALAEMRATNAEWDFMARTYLVLAFANLALAHPERQATYLAQIDRLIDATLTAEAEHGMYFFLMPYARSAEFIEQPARSTFIDGEIALMLGARRMVRDDERYAALHRLRAAQIVERLERSPTRSGESYPDEAWTFCNAIALASLRLSDVLDRSDHSALIAEWLATAKSTLTDPTTGLLISSYHLDGQHRDGPEGSSIFMVAHMLQILDPELARDQWVRAKEGLVRDVLGFGYAREWPASWTGPADVDSGPTIPILGANAGASGMAILGAAAFGDRATLERLLTSLELAAFPVQTEAGRRYRASNTVGDAVMLYALVQGPLWRAVEDRS